MMAEQSEDGQEKTEEPTARKLEKAAEEGQVLSSKEMFVFTGIVGMFGLIYICELDTPAKPSQASSTTK